MPIDWVQNIQDLILKGTVPDFLWKGLISICFMYIIIYGFLQVRQLKVLQQRVSTSSDNLYNFVAYIYLLVQILIFVVTLLML